CTTRTMHECARPLPSANHLRARSAEGSPMKQAPHRVDPDLVAGNRRPLAKYRATHFRYEAADSVATITLDRRERKNPLTFAAYAELRDLFIAMRLADDIHAVVLTGAGDNFSSGGDV